MEVIKTVLPIYTINTQLPPSSHIRLATVSLNDQTLFAAMQAVINGKQISIMSRFVTVAKAAGGRQWSYRVDGKREQKHCFVPGNMLPLKVNARITIFQGFRD